MFECPRCKTAASVRLNRKQGRTIIFRQYQCRKNDPDRPGLYSGCGLIMNTHETVVRNKALDAQLTAEEKEWMFGKPRFKYKSTPPKR